MDARNRIGLYGSYFLGMAAIGFTLPYLPLYLGQRGMSDRAIGLISTLAALAGLAQFPVGLWSDRIGRRKPFLVAALVLVALATVLLRTAQNSVWLGFLVVLFAENGLSRAVVESLAGAEAAALSAPDRVGEALGALRFWKPIGIVLVALCGGWIVQRHGLDAALAPLAWIQVLAIGAALLIRDRTTRSEAERNPSNGPSPASGQGRKPRDLALGAFLAAMVLFHVANAPGGVYLGLFLRRTLHAPERLLAYAFAVSMAAWMLVVWPSGRLADRWGRRPLLIVAWGVMALRLALVSVATSPWQIVANQALDGLANGMFAVLAAAWVTDRLADPRRAGEAQVLVGSSLVIGSALGPALSGLIVESIGYRALFGLLAGIGLLATVLVAACVPETVERHREVSPSGTVEPMAVVSDLSTST